MMNPDSVLLSSRINRALGTNGRRLKGLKTGDLKTEPKCVKDGTDELIKENDKFYTWLDMYYTSEKGSSHTTIRKYFMIGLGDTHILCVSPKRRVVLFKSILQLLQKQKFPGLTYSSFTDHFIKINARGHRAAVIILTVPDNFIVTRGVILSG